jgi:hypothetical protein
VVAILLAVWPVNGTIAFRNIVISFLVILILVFQFSRAKIIFSYKIVNFSVLIALGIFIWLFLHYLYFSNEQVAELLQYRSTVFRCFGAFLIGLICGDMIRENKSLSINIFLIMFIPFVALIYQYLPEAIELNKIFHPQHLVNNLFGGKINAVYLGSMTIAGMLGFSIDEMRYGRFYKKYNLYFIIPISIILFSYVFILDTRNGILISLLLVIIYCLWCVNLLLKRKNNNAVKLKNLMILGAFIFLTVTSFIGQMHYNEALNNIREDIGVSINTSLNDFVKNGENLTRPVRLNGEDISPSTYDRIMRFRMGLNLIQHNTVGYGLLVNSYAKLYNEKYDQSIKGAVHSGWLDLGLAFGWPILSLFFILFFTILLSACMVRGQSFGLIFFLLIALFIVNLLGETSGKHGTEILFFWVGFLITLNIPTRKKI